MGMNSGITENLSSTPAMIVPVGRPDNPLFEAAHALSRESEMIAMGVGASVCETFSHPLGKLPELAASLVTGSALGAISRLGAPGKFVAAGIGTAMSIKFAYDEVTGSRWSKFAFAVKDTWRCADNMDRNIETTKNSLGSFLVDTGIGYAGMKVGALATSRFAPPASLLKDAVRRADTDHGLALRNLENRFEDPKLFKKQVGGKLDFISYSQPAVAGEARGDLVRVAATPDGNILLAAMDVEGHGVKAAKKAVAVHGAIDEILPQTSDKSASDILSLIDGKLSSKDELSVTAGLMKYNPVTHSLETATASSHFAFVVRASGEVKQLDATVGGLGLGNEMYGSFPRGNDIIELHKGDTAVMASDGVFDRFGYGNAKGFQSFLMKAGPDAEKIRRGILETPPPETGADDTSFIIFSPVA